MIDRETRRVPFLPRRVLSRVGCEIEGEYLVDMRTYPSLPRPHASFLHFHFAGYPVKFTGFSSVRVGLVGVLRFFWGCDTLFLRLVRGVSPVSVSRHCQRLL